MAETGQQQVEVTLNEKGRVHLLDRSGRPVTVDEADVSQAIQAGYQVESADSVDRRRLEKEYGDVGSQAATFAEGALEDATLGLGTAALTGILGDEYREEARLREQVNPGSHTAGKVFGSVAPILASGGTSAVARGVSAVGAPARFAAGAGNLAERAVGAGLRKLGVEGTSVLGGVIKRGAQVGAAGAVEGGAYGLGGSIADAALEDTEWTAERALSSMVDGAAFGLPAGAAVGGTGSLLSAAGKAALNKMTGGKSLKAAVQDVAETRAVKAVTGQNKKLYNELTDFGEHPERINRIGRKLLDRNIPLNDLDAGLKAIDGEATEAAGRLKGVAQELDDAGVKVDARKVLESVDQQIADLRRVDLKSHHAVADRLDAEIAPLRASITPKDAPKVVRKPGERAKVEFAEQAGKEFTFSEWWKLRQKFDETLNWAKRGDDPATDNLRKLLAQLDQGLDDAIARHSDEQLKRMAVDELTPEEAARVGDLGKRWGQAKEDYADFRTMRDGIEDQQIRQQSNRFISPSDYGTGGMGGNALGLVAGIASGSVGIGALTGIAGGVAMSAAHKLIRERGAGWIAKAADAFSKFDARTTRAAKVLSGLEPALTPSRVITRGAIQRKRSQDRKERFEEAFRHVQRFTRDPEYAAAQTEKLIAPLAREQPEVASKMAARFNGDMAYLASKAPKGSGSSQTFQPLKVKQHYSRADQQSFVKIVEALADPAAAIDDLAEGDLDLDVIEALKERRPQEYADLRMKVMTYAAELEDEMPYKRRVFLSMAFDYVGDPSLAPENLAAIQASTVEAATGAQQPGPQGSPSYDTQAITEAMSLPSQTAGI